MALLETHKKLILDSANATQLEGRIPDRRRTALVGIKTKIKQTPCNVVTTKKTYRTETEVLLEELRNESAF